MSVLLPAPFSPTRAWTSPRRTSRSTPSSARTPANRLRIARATSKGSGLIRYRLASAHSWPSAPPITRCRAWRGRTGRAPVCILAPTVAWVRSRLGPEPTGRLGILDCIRRVEPADPRLPPQAVDPDLEILRREVGQQDAHGIAPAQHEPVDGQGMSRPAQQDLAAAKLVDVGEDVEHGKDLAGERGELLGKRRAGLRLHHAEPPGRLVERRPRGPLLGQMLDRAERPGGPEERHLARVHARGKLPGFRLGGRPRRVGVHPLPERDRADLDRTLRSPAPGRSRSAEARPSRFSTSDALSKACSWGCAEKQTPSS